MNRIELQKAFFSELQAQEECQCEGNIMAHEINRNIGFSNVASICQSMCPRQGQHLNEVRDPPNILYDILELFLIIRQFYSYIQKNL